jgi:hypothetical protein
MAFVFRFGCDEEFRYFNLVFPVPEPMVSYVLIKKVILELTESEDG